MIRLFTPSTQVRQPAKQQTGLSALPVLLRASTVLFTLAIAACGCTVLSYTGPNGERFTRCSLGNRTAISSLVVESATNGLRRVELRGYQNDAAQALGTVTEAAVRAALQSK